MRHGGDTNHHTYTGSGILFKRMPCVNPRYVTSQSWEGRSWRGGTSWLGSCQIIWNVRIIQANTKATLTISYNRRLYMYIYATWWVHRITSDWKRGFLGAIPGGQSWTDCYQTVYWWLSLCATRALWAAYCPSGSQVTHIIIFLLLYYYRVYNTRIGTQRYAQHTCTCMTASISGSELELGRPTQNRYDWPGRTCSC